LAAACTPQLATPPSTEYPPINSEIPPTSITKPSPTQQKPTLTKAPWDLSNTIGPLQASNIFFNTNTGIFMLTVSCQNNVNACVTNIENILPSATEYTTFDVSPNGNLLALAIVGDYGSEGFQSSIRLFSIREERDWQVAPIGSNFPSWSPDGKYIAYVDYYHSRICLATSQGPFRCFPSHDDFLSPPHWSPDGTRITYRVDQDLFLVNIHKGVPEIIAQKVSGLSWSPDSRFLACLKPAQQNRLQIYKMENCNKLDETCQSQILSIKNIIGLRWSPDGKRIAFSIENGLGKHQIATIDTDCLYDNLSCSESLNYLSNPEENIDSFIWSPDGQDIAYIVERENGADFYMVRVDGKGTILAATIESGVPQQMYWSKSYDE
jgi:Tol biopolymer transport system component